MHEEDYFRRQQGSASAQKKVTTCPFSCLTLLCFGSSFQPDHVPVSLFHVVFTGAKKTFTYAVEYDGKKSDMSIAWFFTATR